MGLLASVRDCGETFEGWHLKKYHHWLRCPFKTPQWRPIEYFDRALLGLKGASKCSQGLVSQDQSNTRLVFKDSAGSAMRVITPKGILVLLDEKEKRCLKFRLVVEPFYSKRERLKKPAWLTN